MATTLSCPECGHQRYGLDDGRRDISFGAELQGCAACARWLAAARSDDEPPPHLLAEVDRLRAENEALRQAIASAPGAPKPGATCGTCGQVQERGAGFDGEATH